MENERLISIQCESKAVLDISDMREFQGNLKSLSEIDYAKLKGEVIQMGFSFPISVWHHEGQNFILDGHQRKRVLSKMRDEGWQVPPVPVSIIYADSYKEAKQKLLGAASQFGKIDGQGLYEFTLDAELDVHEIMERTRLPEMDMDLWRTEYFEIPNIDTSGAADPNSIGSYDSAKDFYSIRVNEVTPSDKEEIIAIVNEALEASGSPYRAGAY